MRVIHPVENTMARDHVSLVVMNQLTNVFIICRVNKIKCSARCTKCEAKVLHAKTGDFKKVTGSFLLTGRA